MIRRLLVETTAVLAVGAALATGGGVVGIALQAYSPPCAVAPGSGGSVASASAPRGCAVAGASAPVGAASAPVGEASAPVAEASAPRCVSAATPDTSAVVC